MITRKLTSLFIFICVTIPLILVVSLPIIMLIALLQKNKKKYFERVSDMYLWIIEKLTYFARGV